MFIGLNEKKQRVDIRLAAGDQKYFCPCCGGELIQKRGVKKAHHFAHCVNDIHCAALDMEMSKWHRDWQDEFPPGTNEIIFEFGGKKHISDVTIGKVAIEFQHSQITAEEFQDRNYFYSNTHAALIWVFDVQAKDGITQLNAENKFNWKRAPSMFNEFNADSYHLANPDYYLFLDYGEARNPKPLLCVTWNRQGMKYFCGKWCSRDSFVRKVFELAEKKRDVPTFGRRTHETKEGER